MPKLNRRQAQFAIQSEQEFQSHTGNLTARWEQEGSTKTYLVCSYGVPVARVIYSFEQKDDGDVVQTRDVWFTQQKYSVTTSNHTNLARRSIYI
jgi:hypothetical protein